ncbi:MAG: hypothetical protein ABJL57_15805 [Hyphomonas sp.]|mgnify:FL=1|jgi:hypothetical protein|uniref:hypothetical protein n=1 Tax=Hyphomonas sp. TaxID=87 RepID=UPI003263083A
MSDTATPPSAKALESLLGQRDRFARLGEKDFAAATMLLVKKLMISAGQTTDDMKALRETVGRDLFETTLKSLTAHQARQLARRMDRSVPDLEVSTAGAACAWIRGLMNGTNPAPTEPAKAAEDTGTDDTPPAPKNAYFGRKAFRTGG